MRMLRVDIASHKWSLLNFMWRWLYCRFITMWWRKHLRSWWLFGDLYFINSVQCKLSMSRMDIAICERFMLYYLRWWHKTRKLIMWWWQRSERWWMFIHMSNLDTFYGYHTTYNKQFIINRNLHYRKNITRLFSNVFNGLAYNRPIISMGISKFPTLIISIILTISDIWQYSWLQQSLIVSISHT